MNNLSYEEIHLRAHQVTKEYSLENTKTILGLAIESQDAGTGLSLCWMNKRTKPHRRRYGPNKDTKEAEKTSAEQVLWPLCMPM